MPKLELGDLETVAKYKDFNIPQLKHSVDEGTTSSRDPFLRAHVQAGAALMFPDDADVQAVKARIFDPFEYLMLRPQGRPPAHGLHAEAGQGQLPRALSSARAEHRA
jgi:hypothetical protein